MIKETLTLNIHKTDKESIRIVSASTLNLEQALDLLIKNNEQLQAELDKATNVIDKIYDMTSEGYVIELIDVLRGDAVWGEDGTAEYLKKGE